MPSAAAVESVGTFRARLGECPTWDAADACPWWVDIPGKLVIRTSPDGRSTSYPCPAMPGCLARTSDRQLIVGLADGFYRFDLDSQAWSLCRRLPDGDELMMNDGRCDPAGRFVAGTMSISGKIGAAALYSLEGGTLRSLLAGVTTSNGLDWSPDGAVMYYIDSGTYRVDAIDYDLETGSVGERRALRAFDPELGLPDGLAVDAEGGIWVTLWGSGSHQRGGGRLLRLTPGGAIDLELTLPTEGSTSCCFGGDGLDTLFLTTSYEFLDEEQRRSQPLAGHLLALDAGVAGARSAVRYAAPVAVASVPTSALRILV